ncbi:hypothetical protein NPIL_576891 [Nephila pilipes]|uniref:Uncharacterized protein n=1 Tax=Nephila pilipes TaxID=299642 RepID=A0A8X6TE92_NEPPI|nr:hypothetical protein NPIL_576891 [Nephila pilipes]
MVLGNGDPGKCPEDDPDCDKKPEMVQDGGSTAYVYSGGSTSWEDWWTYDGISALTKNAKDYELKFDMHSERFKKFSILIFSLKPLAISSGLHQTLKDIIEPIAGFGSAFY